MVGTFIGFGVLQLLGGTTDPVVPVWLLLTIMVAVSMAGCAGLGVAIERFAYRPLRDAPRIAPLISALGVSFFLENSVLLLRSEEHTSELQSPVHLVCRLLLEKKKKKTKTTTPQK